MVVKWPIIPIIDQAYFQALPINQHATFYGSQKKYERQKVARVKGIDHFHYDIIHAKVSGSCSKDCAQGRSIAGNANSK